MSAAENTPASARMDARDLALIAVFVGIMAALGLVPAFYPFGNAVPITAQSMGIMLAGGILGARRGALAMLVFIALVAVGLPLLAGGRGGLGVFVSPSAGFWFGAPVAAYVVGVLTERFLGSSGNYRVSTGILANVIGGVVVLHLCGIAGIMVFGHMSFMAALAVVAVFLPGDAIKAVVAAVVSRGVHAGRPGLLGRRGGRRGAAVRG